VCAPNGGAFGDDCSPGQAPCRSGLCLDIGTARLCTDSCEGSGICPEGFSCSLGLDAETQQEVQICFPSGGGVRGADCSFGPAACSSRLCLKTGGIAFCVEPCGADGSCEGDWVCDPEAQTVDGQTRPVCVPPRYAPT